MTVEIDGTKKEFIVYTGSPVKIIPLDEETIKDKKFLPIPKIYRDGNKNEVRRKDCGRSREWRNWREFAIFYHRMRENELATQIGLATKI